MILAEVGPIVAITGTVLAVIAAAGAVLAFLSAARGRNVIELQAQEIAAQKSRINTLEAEVERNRIQINELQSSVDVLTEAATQAAAVAELAETTRAQHEEIVAALQAIQQLLKRSRARA